MQNAKLNAARKAVEYVRGNKIIGLGTGSTSSIFIGLAAELVKAEGLDITFVASSVESWKMALERGLEVADFNDVGKVDLYVDGADAVNGKLCLVKGLGGALAREKILAYASRKFVCIIDESKLKEFVNVVVPIEVMQFNYRQVIRFLSDNGAVPGLRTRNGSPFVTDNGNFIIDALYAKIINPERLERELKLIPGVIENGIFSRVDVVVVGTETGSRILARDGNGKQEA